MRTTLGKELYKSRFLYILLLPTILYFVIFQYLPMYGVLLAFKEYHIRDGVLNSPWNGLDNFREVVAQSDFWRAFRNTILISIGRIVLEFPAAIILALLINEVSKQRLKKIYQTVYTFPHFISWVIVSGIIFNFLSNDGVLNQIFAFLGEDKVSFLTNPGMFKPILFITNIWKEVGWSAIIYLAAIAGINPELYEAAHIDGAGRFQQLRAITWPAIRGTAGILLILAVGSTMNGGFDQVFNLYNAAVYSTGDIIDTYVYRSTFAEGSSFGVSTAVGLFKAVLNFGLLYLANFIVKKLGEDGLV